MDSTSRRLKKYEAEAIPVIADTEEPAMDYFSPFGPLIAKLKFPRDIVERVNRHADMRVSTSTSSEFLLPQNVIMEGTDRSLVHYVAALVRRYLEQVENSLAPQVGFDVFWIVSQYAGTPSPVHFHSGDIAGILYLKVPEIDPVDEVKTYIAGRQAGYINFLIGGKQPLSKSLISFKPEVGDFYLFPAWLLHVAEPFRGSGERRSMSFNAVVGAEDR